MVLKYDAPDLYADPAKKETDNRIRKGYAEEKGDLSWIEKN